jgi:hypothetical protein
MNENRRRILEMLGEGKLSTEEAERLLSALDEGPRPSLDGDALSKPPSGQARYLRVVVEPEPDAGPQDRERVNIRVPLALFRAGIKLSALLPSGTADGINEALRSKGLDFDVHNIKSDAVDELISSLTGLEINVQDGGQKVRVYAE